MSKQGKRLEVEIVARGVCIRDGQLLLCHSRGADNTYLPGGHVEFDESAPVSLAREIEEEMQLESEVGDFLGVVEHQFIQKGEPHCEINLVFRCDIAGLDAGSQPPSAEAHLDFRWCPLDRLEESALEPYPLRELLPAWIDAGPANWGSTF